MAVTETPGGDLESPRASFFPSRWRTPLTSVAVLALATALGAAGWLVWTGISGAWTSEHWGTVVLTVVLLGSSVRVLRVARRIGVTVSDEGVRLAGGSFLNPAGHWTWDEIEDVDVVEEEHVRDAPRQVLLSTRSGERVRLGPITGRDAMVAQIRSRLRPSNRSK